jgi:hypothetical protein
MKCWVKVAKDEKCSDLGLKKKLHRYQTIAEMSNTCMTKPSICKTKQVQPITIARKVKDVRREWTPIAV